MKKRAVLFVGILSACLLAGCGKEADVTENTTNIEEYLATIQGIEKYDEVVDYSKEENWLQKDSDGDKAVDVIHFYPTAYGTTMPTSDDLASIDDSGMRMGAKYSSSIQASVFEKSCNLYIPYYRQLTVRKLIESVNQGSEVLQYIAAQDIYRALDYYFENYNQGKPFILSGHSQGSVWVTVILEDYMKQHPEYLENMVAAYVIGYSVTEEYLQKNTHLKFAQGADDTGVIISYNVEGPANKDAFNCVVREGAISINPINWRLDDTYASAEENLGSMNLEGEMLEHLADARVDTERGVVICESVDETIYAQAATNAFGPESYHNYDYGFYYMNLRQNVADRIEAFWASRK